MNSIITILLDPRIFSPIISIIVSIITVTVTLKVKSVFENKNYVSKLENEHRYEQRKKLKDILSINKIQLMNSCELLNHRLWNFNKHYKVGWHIMNGDYSANPRNYYFNSFIYRFITVFSWIKKIEEEMVYLDSTIALKEDMDFIKYLRLLPQIMCDAVLFEGHKYDEFFETDHFFRNNLDKMAQCLIHDSNVCTYSQFDDNMIKYLGALNSACRFVDGMSPSEARLRWDRMQVLHISIIAFLNAFGYDFQFTSKEKLKDLLNRTRRNKFWENFIYIVDRNKLANQKALKDIIEVIKSPYIEMTK